MRTTYEQCALRSTCLLLAVLQREAGSVCGPSPLPSPLRGREGIWAHATARVRNSYQGAHEYLSRW